VWHAPLYQSLSWGVAYGIIRGPFAFFVVPLGPNRIMVGRALWRFASTLNQDKALRIHNRLQILRPMAIRAGAYTVVYPVVRAPRRCVAVIEHG